MSLFLWLWSWISHIIDVQQSLPQTKNNTVGATEYKLVKGWIFIYGYPFRKGCLPTLLSYCTVVTDIARLYADTPTITAVLGYNYRPQPHTHTHADLPHTLSALAQCLCIIYGDVGSVDGGIPHIWMCPLSSMSESRVVNVNF